MKLLKPALFVLLAINAGVYAAEGRLSEGLDALAWFVLLALFGIETRYPQWTRRARNAAALAVPRLIAAAGVAVAAFSYLSEHEWLDATNAWLWIAVVLVLEFQVRAPSLCARYRSAVTATSAVLYGALVVVALVWLAQDEWFDAYDALLWIAAFALIEMDLFKLAGHMATQPKNSTA